ncbi:Ca-activated chloride channel family protein [Microbacterium terrae]|uniref:von Willebrand factor type A domain protein n=1 Tax=Microbacterium terrae TaxID=69369 RepID=A0A0M2H7W5_9MICO|nr:substrate-binding domain-containing protein [Microbacterium terrae]KJL40071.1 von Willebrand factor type A domain protein [Microbacterium terrae]MBP1079214.1 Ca-activated chloride channel family protein [Microbacterium terrae]GLJ98614.1 VWA domain-containing protein [Microbacterium terrae]
MATRPPRQTSSTSISTARSRARRGGALALLTALALTGCSFADDGGGDFGDGDFVDDGCTSVVVATSSEKVNMLDELADAFKESPEHDALDECATVRPINVSSGDATRFLTSGEDWPDEDTRRWPVMWSPASTVWTDRVAAAASASLVGEPESFTHTPVVFGVPETMAKALGYPGTDIGITDFEALCQDPDGWASVGKPIWGSFKISKTNPNTSTTGLSAILMQSYEASGKQADLTAADVAASAEFSRVFEECVIHYGDTTGKVLNTLYDETQNGAGGSGYVSAVALEETSLLNYNQGNPDSHTVQPGETLTPPKEKLVAVYPSGGSMWSDNPITVLGADWVTGVQAEAGAAFAAFLQTDAAQQILPEYGFRPLDASVPLGDLFTAEYGVDPAGPAVTLPKPAVDVVSAAIDQWTQIRKPSSVLEVIDISGSMDEEIGDGRSKLDGAIEGAQSTLGHFRSSDEVGVWAFTTGVSSAAGENIVVLRDVSPLASDREAVDSSLDDLRFADREGTPLYDAIAAAYDEMTARAEPGRINAIVVLSDGQDTDSTMSLDSLIARIGSTSGEGGEDSPVRIFPIAYGEGADTSALQRIAEATGGQWFDASDAAKIDLVFASVINNF